jgi:hypothetical protein
MRSITDISGPRGRTRRMAGQAAQARRATRRLPAPASAGLLLDPGVVVASTVPGRSRPCGGRAGAAVLCGRRLLGVRVFCFMTEDGCEQIATDGFYDWAAWGFETGVEVSESTTTDAFTTRSCWLVCIEIDEALIAPYLSGQPSSPFVRSVLFGRNLGPHAREWLVPAELLNQHGTITDVGDFSQPAFAARSPS